jgi:pimeloyl-ACP methyl ester carboxylesterase
MDRASSFRRVIAELTDLDVTAYDRRGYGDAVARGPAGSFADHVDDLLDVIGGRPSVVAGHSLGGDVALAAAVRSPDVVRAVVAYEPPMPWQPWWPSDTAGGAAAAERPEDAAEAFVRRMVGDDVWYRLPPSTKAQRRAEGPALIAELLAVQTTAVVDPAAVTVPVVLGVGGNGRDHHQLNTRKLVDLLPDAELTVIDGAFHGAHLSHPKQFAGLIRRAMDLVNP